MYLQSEKLSQGEMYKILIAGVAPRPIAWAGTRSKSGQDNLAPFSFYNAFSSKPPIVGFSTIPRPDGRDKDTLSNINESGCFTLSAVTHALAPLMSKTSATLEPEESEFDYAGLKPVTARSVNAPYVEGAPLVFECELRQIINFGQDLGSGNLILGEIKYIQVSDELYDQDSGRLDFEKLDLVGRLAGNWYSTIRDKFEMQRG